MRSRTISMLLGCASLAPLALGCAEPPPAVVPPPVQASAPPISAALLTSEADICMPIDLALPAVRAAAAERPVPPIARAELLAPLFDHAARVLRGRARTPVRIAVYGDSNLTRDFMTGRMRRVLQRRFGDAGHGFVALGRPWDHYRHMDVRHGVHGFEPYAASTAPLLDRGYGISGIAAESAYRGARTWVATAAPGAPVGTRANRAEIYYLAGPSYGRFHVVVDGVRATTVDTRAVRRAFGVYRLYLEDAPHRIELVAAGARRRVRLLGAALEREVPSFIVDSFGVGALNSFAQAREDAAINHAMLQTRDYDLVIFATGANDVFTLDRSAVALSELLEVHRQALPDTPILILSPGDRGMRRTFPLTLKVAEQRRSLAAAEHVAYWNLLEAMGGPDAMAVLARRGLVERDYIHLTQRGGAWVGDRLLFALWRSLRDHLAAHPQAGCDGAWPWR